jgi:hypothetical protein
MKTRNCIELYNTIQPFVFQQTIPTKISHRQPAVAMQRAYFRSLRAAEMAAWELTGGDYLTSDLATSDSLSEAA